ncbi:MAG: hypothetical protein EXR72_11520 [Myxococcales bacterium]|nr:hypothetical protein [Myxococcales bacterium]
MLRRAWPVCLMLLGCERPPERAAGEVPLDAGSADLFPPQGQGSLFVTVSDDESGLPMPARVIVTAVGKTPGVAFDLDRQGRSTGFGAHLTPLVIGAPEGVLLVGGAGAWPVPVGTYDLFLTRGPEWEAETRRVTVESGGVTAVAAALRRSVDTRGWLAADLHVHTARSYDSRLRLENQVVGEVAVGVELIVATDHNVLTDLQPEVERLGYERLARAIVGDEFNFLEGHGGAYPMPYDRSAPDTGGTVAMGLDWPSVRLIHSAQMFAWLRSFPTRPAVTVNHPRLPPDLGYFLNLGWAPPQALEDAGLFDAIELLNGYQDSPPDIAELLRDWFFLLNGGTRLSALGSSDSHSLRDVKAGFPRTWLRMPTEEPGEVEGADLGEAIKRQRAIASTGPFARLTVDGAEIGDLVTAEGQTVKIDALCDAPRWIDVDRVRLYVNGKLAREVVVPRGGQRPLFHEVWEEVLPSGDSWVVLQAGGTKPLPAALIGDHGERRGLPVLPFVITSPVFVDGDGDGKWTPVILPRDPGPIGPAAPESDPGWPRESRWRGPPPEECEPPLWADPATWVNP